MKLPLKIKVPVLAAVAALLGPAGCEKKPPAAAPPALVEVTTVTQTDVPIYHEWIGELDGLVNAQIRAQVTGYLMAQNYHEGDPIRKGDRLFEIDPRPFQAALDQAKGVLTQAEAREGKTDLDVKRYKPLVKDQAISQEEYDDAVQADLEAKAAVVSAQAQVEQARLNLEFTKITSPVDGIASIARAQIGDLVGPSTGELTTVSTIDPIKAYYNVTEQAYINFTRLYSTESNRYDRLKQLETQLILTDGKPYPLMGTNYAIDRQIGQTTGALRVEALFSESGWRAASRAIRPPALEVRRAARCPAGIAAARSVGIAGRLPGGTWWMGTIRFTSNPSGPASGRASSGSMERRAAPGRSGGGGRRPEGS